MEVEISKLVEILSLNTPLELEVDFWSHSISSNHNGKLMLSPSSLELKNSVPDKFRHNRRFGT